MPREKSFFDLARERFKLSAEAEAATREKALDDFEFRIGEQWPLNIRNERSDQHRPCLTINRIPRTIAQVTNEQRQQRPAIQVNPVGDGADKELAEVQQGTIRHIEVNSDAEIAYDMAFEHMVTGGTGYFRVITDYPDDESDEQEIYIRPIENPFAVYGDPFESYNRKAYFYFIVEDMGKEEFKREFKDSELASLDDWSAQGNAAPGWIRKDGVRVAEYFWIEETPGKRKPKCTVHWTKINGIEELCEPTEWAVDEIPVFKVIGEEINIDGKKHVAGLVRHAKDSQRMYNFWVSAATEMIALAPKPKYVAAAGQIENYKAQWERANQSNIGVLTYDPQSVNGSNVPPPHLEVYEPPVQAIHMMTMQSDNDFKATTGIYDASLGKQGPDESARAILARQKQTDIATLNFSDNLSRTIRRLARHLLKLIPKIYDTRTVMRIVKPDGTSEMVPVNDAKLEDGVKRVFDLRTGRFDVTVSVGPSYQSKRQEAVSTQLELAKSFPIVANVAPDIVIRNMDIPQADEIADRVKLMLPPQVLQAEDQNIVPKLQAQLHQAMAQHDMAIQQLQQAKEIISQKQVEAQAKVTIAKMDNITKIAVAEITTKAQDARMRAEAELDILGQQHDAAHDVAMQQQDHENSKALAQQQQQAAMQQSEMGHQQALEQALEQGQQQASLSQSNQAE